MSDVEEGEKKTGYRLEYASSARAKCKGPKPCAGNPIEKGALRFGSLVDFRGNTSFAWRHWGCVTAKIITNMQAQFETADELDGFDELRDEDQERVRKAWEDGHVADADVPETARKDAEDEEDDAKPAKKKKADKKEAAADAKAKFKLEYASSSRAKCKEGCGESIGKDFFRAGHEVDFRGNKSLSWQHWGCMPASMVAKLKQSYDTPEEIEGFDELKEAEQEKVKRAWEEGAIPVDDQGPGEAVAIAKKAPVKRAKKAEGEKPAKKRVRKAKKDDDDDEDEDDEEEVKPARKRAKKSKADDDDDEEVKPKGKRAAAKKAPAKAAPKKRASKKKEDEESGEDFAAEIDAVSGDEEEEEEEPKPKPKRKAASKPASKASALPSKKGASKSTSSRKKQQEVIDEEDDD